MKETLQAQGILGQEKYLMEIRTTNHIIKVDEPKSIGGQDLFPNPAQYLLSALASCTAITMKMYADNKGWDPGDIHVDVQLKGGDNETKSKKKIVKKVTFENPIVESQVERLLAIASKCPISKLIENPVAMEFQ